MREKCYLITWTKLIECDNSPNGFTTKTMYDYFYAPSKEQAIQDFHKAMKEIYPQTQYSINYVYVRV